MTIPFLLCCPLNCKQDFWVCFEVPALSFREKQRFRDFSLSLTASLKHCLLIILYLLPTFTFLVSPIFFSFLQYHACLQVKKSFQIPWDWFYVDSCISTFPCLLIRSATPSICAYVHQLVNVSFSICLFIYLCIFIYLSVSSINCLSICPWCCAVWLYMHVRLSMRAKNLNKGKDEAKGDTKLKLKSKDESHIRDFTPRSSHFSQLLQF